MTNKFKRFLEKSVELAGTSQRQIAITAGLDRERLTYYKQHKYIDEMCRALIAMREHTGESPKKFIERLEKTIK